MSTSHPYPPVKLELGGKTWELRLTWLSMRLIREHLGEGADTANAADHMGLYLWRAMGRDPELTLEEVEDMVDLRDSPRVLAAIFEMIGNDMPAQEGGEAEADEGKGRGLT
jgi:hypothetical protein